MAPLSQERPQDVHGQDDQCRPNDALADRIHPSGQRQVQGDHENAENGDREGMPKGIEEPETHPLSPTALHACDIRDRREMVVVEPMPQPQQSAGEEGEMELCGHLP
jgi:hypothetical protein